MFWQGLIMVYFLCYKKSSRFCIGCFFQYYNKYGSTCQNVRVKSVSKFVSNSRVKTAIHRVKNGAYKSTIDTQNKRKKGAINREIPIYSTLWKWRGLRDLKTLVISLKCAIYRDLKIPCQNSCQTISVNLYFSSLSSLLCMRFLKRSDNACEYSFSLSSNKCW